MGASCLLAQVKWAPKGAKWYYTRPYYNAQQATDNFGDCVVFKSLGDTLIIGQHAIALEVRYCSGDSISTEIVKQSGDTLFYLNHNKFYPLYNFSAKVGDTITVHLGWFEPVKACLFRYDSVNGFKYKITDIDSVDISGQWLKRQTVNSLSRDWSFCDNNPPDKYIIEKLGSLTYFFGKYSNFIPEENITLLRCYTDSTIVYHNPRWTSTCDLVGIKKINIPDSPAKIHRDGNNTLSVQLYRSEKSVKLYIYDISGRVLDYQMLKKKKTFIPIQNLKNGIYLLKIVTETNSQTYKFIKQ